MFVSIIISGMLHVVLFFVCYRVCRLSRLRNQQRNKQVHSLVLPHKMGSQTTVHSGQNITAP